MTMPYRTPLVSETTAPRRRPQQPKAKRLTNRADLPPRAENVLRAIYEYQKAHKFPAAIRDIATTCLISSTSVVNYYLDRLERFGFIERQRHVTRGIIITASGLERLGYSPKLVSIVCPHCHEPFDAQSDGMELVVITKPDGDQVIKVQKYKPRRMPVAG